MAASTGGMSPNSIRNPVAIDDGGVCGVCGTCGTQVAAGRAEGRSSARNRTIGFELITLSDYVFSDESTREFWPVM